MSTLNPIEKAQASAAAAAARAEEMVARYSRIIGDAVLAAAANDPALRRQLAGILTAAKLTKPDRALVAHLRANLEA